MFEYARTHLPGTVDILSQENDAMAEGEGPVEKEERVDAVYSEHLLPSAIQKGVKSGRFYQGVYHASRFVDLHSRCLSS